jgi:hypothetical protein
MRANKVKSLSPNHRSVIALHSPSAAEFLCNPDCVAEREGFEPSVQVPARTNGLAIHKWVLNR